MKRLVKAIKTVIAVNKKEIMDKIQDIPTEFMGDTTKDGDVVLYDFEDSGYIEDVERILDKYNVKYKSSKDGIKIFFKDLK